MPDGMTTYVVALVKGLYHRLLTLTSVLRDRDRLNKITGTLGSGLDTLDPGASRRWLRAEMRCTAVERAMSILWPELLVETHT